MLSDQQIRAAASHCLTRADLPELGAPQVGKVRDAYLAGGRRVLVTTDRVSAFDRVVGAVPYKGQVLNQLAAFWFEQTADLLPSHLLSVPDPNVSVVADAAPLPVEVIVRGYITGVTSTALWTLYAQGVERPYGLRLPPGLRKNDPLPAAVITPTTKATAGAHDERLTCDEVVQRGLVGRALWGRVQAAALAVFARGQQLAARAGLILVDTKYEFGLVGGELRLIDEVHTPDSSRFWLASSYAERHARGEEPEQLDKELLRRHLVERGYRGEGPAPEVPLDTICLVARRYMESYERLTGQAFIPGELPAGPRIRANLAGLLGRD